MSYRHHSIREAWYLISKDFPGIYDNLLKIVKVVLVASVSSVENERIFSKMNFIKSN